MRKGRWLHISDLHLRTTEDGPQQAVLSAMLESLASRYTQSNAIDFIVVTGDLAFSGGTAEYRLVGDFFDRLATSTGVDPDKMFCVPGNHDVQRGVSKLAFRGARESLQNQAAIYELFADEDEREALLLRHSEYRDFQSRFWRGQEREYTPDGLAYVSRINVDDLDVAIMGLNSSWLAHGGPSDEGMLLVGEVQVRAALEIAEDYEPHILLALQHHPFESLRGFDQPSVRRRLEDACDFVHLGHLHNPGLTGVLTDREVCVHITAGAAFQSRGASSSFTVVEFDPLAGSTEVTVDAYNPGTGLYEYERRKRLDHPRVGGATCGVYDLAGAIASYCGEARELSGFLAELLTGNSSDVPMPSDGGVRIGNWDLVESAADSGFRRIATDFMRAASAIRILHAKRPFAAVLDAHGAPIASFARILNDLSASEPRAKEYLAMRKRQRDRAQPLRHSEALLADLIKGDRLDEARAVAERILEVSEGGARTRVVRNLATILSMSTDRDDILRACALWKEAAGSERAEPVDWAALATIRLDLEQYDEAKDAIRTGIARFPDQIDAFVEVGMKLALQSDDPDFNAWLLRVRDDKNAR